MLQPVEMEFCFFLMFRDHRVSWPIHEISTTHIQHTNKRYHIAHDHLQMHQQQQQQREDVLTLRVHMHTHNLRARLSAKEESKFVYRLGIQRFCHRRHRRVGRFTAYARCI